MSQLVLRVDEESTRNKFVNYDQLFDVIEVIDIFLGNTRELSDQPINQLNERLISKLKIPGLHFTLKMKT